MNLSTIFLSFLIVALLPPQQATLRQRYEAAQALAREGKSAAAEAEYASVLVEGYRKLGRIYAALKEREKAILAAEAAANLKPESGEVLLELAIAYLEAAQFKQALEPLGKACRLNPKNANAQRMLGKTYFALRDYEKSAMALAAALEIEPDDFNTNFTLAITYLQQRQFTHARQAFDRMIAQFGKQPQLHIMIGRAFREAGGLSEAIDEFKKAIALNDRLPGAHYNLGLAYLLNEGAAALANAEEEFKTELVSNPNEYFANYYLGIVHIFNRKWDLAVESLRKASEVRPDNPDPYFQLGQAYQELLKHDLAIAVLRKAIDLNPEFSHNKFQVTTAHYRLAQSLLKTGQIEAGRKELRIAADQKARAFEIAQTISTGPSTMGTSSLPEENSQMVATVAVSTTPANALNPAAAAALKSSETYHVRIIAAVHNSIGLLRAEAKDFVRAADQFRQVRKWNPGQEGLDYNLGLAYFRLELYKDAVQVLENAVRVDQGNTQARWLLGMSYFRTRVFSKVPGLLADVPAASTNVDLCYALASSLIREGKPDLADPAIQRIATLVDNSPTLHVVRGQQHFARGDIERAREELTVGLSINRQEPQAHYFLGLIYLKKQMVAEALKEFEAELLLNPNNVEARYQLGLTLLVSRDNSRGIQTMREVVKVDPDFPGARYELGKALLEQEEIPAAVENLEIAAKLDPENALVHFELSRAYFAAGRREEGKRESDIFNRLKKATGSQTAP